MCADVEESLVTWQILLQYLCARPQSATWMLETVAAAAGALPPDYAGTAEQIHQVKRLDLRVQIKLPTPLLHGR